MPIPRELAAHIDTLPFDAATGLRTLTVTAADDSIDLAPGAYVAVLSGTVDGVARIGGAASVPASNAAELAGAFFLPAGAAVTFVVGGSATVSLHALLVAAGAATLYLMRML